MNNDFTILHLSLIKGAGPAIINKLVERQSDIFKLSDLYDMGATDIQRLGESDIVARKIADGLSDIEILDKECALIEKHGISWATRYSQSYPELLAAIHMPPVVLYWRGSDIAEHQKGLAIVGARKSNAYGERCINRIVPELVAHDWSIISGGAIGADSMAHRAALHSGGKTVVVLGTGLLKPAPLSNVKLFEEALQKGGTIVSACPLNQMAVPGCFPARNRIISGLSRGCLVTQAAAKSGAKITAQYALDQGRDVFAVPGSVEDELSAGCNQLIQQGAKLVMRAEDILEEYEIGAPFVPKPQVRALDRVRSESQMPIVPDLPAVTTPEGIVIRACVQACSIDELAAKTNMSLPEIQGKLFEMQLDGTIRQDFSGMWVNAK